MFSKIERKEADQKAERTRDMGRKISAIKSQQKPPFRINIFLDGEYAFSVHRIVGAWLKVGQELSDEKITELQRQDIQEEAFQRALKLLTGRPHSEAEIRKNLMDHGISEELVDEVIERLKEKQLLDDVQFAQTWIENRSEFRPRGRRALAFELRQRGVDAQTISTALENLDEEGLAYCAGKKYASRLTGLGWQAFRQKLSGFLTRRGFGYETISIVVRKIWAESPANSTDTEHPNGIHDLDRGIYE